MRDHVHDINHEAPSTFPPDLPSGTSIYILPIRWWENTAPETGRYLRHGGLCGNGSQSLFIHHDAYGHEVYVNAQDCFTTTEAAVVEAERRTDERKRRCEADLQRVLAELAIKRGQT